MSYLKRIRKSRGNYIPTYDNQLYEEYFHQSDGSLSSSREGKKRSVQGNTFPAARQTHRGDGVGLGPVLQQDVDDVSVALLSSLVERGVPVLLSTAVTAKANKEQEPIIRSDVHFASFCSFGDISNTNYDTNRPQKSKPSVIIILLPQINKNTREGSILVQK